MKYYSILSINGGLLEDDKIIEAKNSKIALEKLLKCKVKKIRKYEKAEYSVVECDNEGRLYRDKRKWIYYKINKQ